MRWRSGAGLAFPSTLTRAHRSRCLPSIRGEWGSSWQSSAFGLDEESEKSGVFFCRVLISGE